jgi:hypothetical protein
MSSEKDNQPQEILEAVIQDHENYVVKSDGTVWRTHNVYGVPFEDGPHQVSTVVKKKSGHLYVTLASHTHVNKRTGERTHYTCVKQVPVMWLVARAFVKRLFPFWVPMPKDGDVKNVTASNIRWVNRKVYLQKMQAMGKLMSSEERSKRLSGIDKSDEGRENMRASKTGIYNANSLGVWLVDGKEFFSAVAAGRYAGMSPQRVMKFCMGERTGFGFIPKAVYIARMKKERKKWAVIEPVKKKKHRYKDPED